MIISINMESNIPSFFLCPLSMQIMDDPTIDYKDNNYDRSHIVQLTIIKIFLHKIKNLFINNY